MHKSQDPETKAVIGRQKYEILHSDWLTQNRQIQKERRWTDIRPVTEIIGNVFYAFLSVPLFTLVWKVRWGGGIGMRNGGIEGGSSKGPKPPENTTSRPHRRTPVDIYIFSFFFGMMQLI